MGGKEIIDSGEVAANDEIHNVAKDVQGGCIIIPAVVLCFVLVVLCLNYEVLQGFAIPFSFLVFVF